MNISFMYQLEFRYLFGVVPNLFLNAMQETSILLVNEDTSGQ